jgi:hypothetical protein
MAGIAPWLETGPRDEGGAEARLRARFAELARETIDAATDPASPDVCNFDQGRQPVVDAAFLAHAIVRAPQELWAKLPSRVQRNAAAALMRTRTIQPAWNNWLLFAAMVEAALLAVGESWQRRPVQTAVTLHETWYKGDGVYGDGPELHWDYYNSFVIHPMLLDVLRVAAKQERAWETMLPKAVARARRYAEIQERLISPEGTYPPIGRSLAYRIGVFQALGQVALMRELPKDLAPAQVRSALTAVYRKQMGAPHTFDGKGWLRIGFAGHQPGVGETYISTGLLPLGLPASDEFWAGAARPWTAVKMWSGEDLPADHALRGE